MTPEQVPHSPVRRAHTPPTSRDTNDNMSCDECNGKQMIVTPTCDTQDSLFLAACDSVLCSMDLCMPLDPLNTCMGPVDESDRGLLTPIWYPTVIPLTSEAKAPTAPQRRGRFLVWPVSVSPMPTVETRS